MLPLQLFIAHVGLQHPLALRLLLDQLADLIQFACKGCQNGSHKLTKTFLFIMLITNLGNFFQVSLLLEVVDLLDVQVFCVDARLHAKLQPFVRERGLAMVVKLLLVEYPGVHLLELLLLKIAELVIHSITDKI